MNAQNRWWVISAEDFLAALCRVRDGQDPAKVYADYYDNSDREEIAGREVKLPSGRILRAVTDGDKPTVWSDHD